MDGQIQIKEMTEQLMNVRLDLRELTTEVRSMKNLAESVVDMDKRLTAVEESAKSAHLRMNKIERIHMALSLSFATGIIGGIVAFIMKGGLTLK